MAKAKATPAPEKDVYAEVEEKVAPTAQTETFRARYNNDNDHNIKIFVENNNITEWKIIESLLPEDQTDPEEVEFYHKTIEYSK